MPNPTHAPRSLVEARLDTPASAKLVAFYEAPHLEREKRQFQQYIQVDLAHTVMLAEQGILQADQAARILATLREIETMGPEKFPLDPSKGSFLLQVEDYLFSRVGEDTGGRMHTGRSRLDQGPTVRRLYKRAGLLQVFDALLVLQQTLIDTARQHVDTIMPGYTCLQHAHPAVFGHYLLSFQSKLDDDFSRLRAAYQRLNLNPLGAAGLAGTSWPIDRLRTTALLGFDGLVENAKLAREAYYAAEVAGALSFVMSTLNDLATDLHLWSSYEFGYVETADEFCGTSSIFPQKKNPAGLEAIKFAAGGAVTWLATALATFRAEGTGDVVMRETPLLDEALPATQGSLDLMAAIVATLKVNKERMASASGANWSTATNLADEIVRGCGASFRQAHHVVARFVRRAMEAGISMDAVDAEMLRQAAVEVGVAGMDLSTESIRSALDVRAFVRSRQSRGSVNPSEIEGLAQAAQRQFAAATEWLACQTQHIAAAERSLDAAVSAWTTAQGRLS